MTIGVNDITPNPKNIFLLWDGLFPNQEILEQIRICLRSIECHAPSAKVYLFSNILDDNHLQNIPASIVKWNYSSLGLGTPIAGNLPEAQSSWRSWSNLFRIVCLWRWGGTYFDVDDIMVRPLSAISNCMAACFLTPKQYELWLPEQTIDGKYSSLGRQLRNIYQFRFGNDPMTNFTPENPFLEKYMLEVVKHPTSNWGQILPTRIFAENPEWSYQYINPISWADLLYHPYDGGHHPCDQRYSGSPIFTQSLFKMSDYPRAWSKIFDAYKFCLVKNHQFSCQNRQGEKQSLLHWIIQACWEKHSNDSSL